SPPRRHRRDDPRHAHRRARASREEVRTRHALRGRRHGHRHRRRAPLTATEPADIPSPDIEGTSVSTSAVRYEKADGIVNLVIDDPSQNANTMNQAYRDGMEQAVNQL